MEKKILAPRNRTLQVGDLEQVSLLKQLSSWRDYSAHPGCSHIVQDDSLSAIKKLKAESVDLVFADPPYNLTKKFETSTFKERSDEAYEQWLREWMPDLKRVLKPNGSLYVCGDYKSSGAIERVGAEHFHVQNRITWEREKGRGAKKNWKNSSEDIWFFTRSDEFTFNVDQVKLRRKVKAPYKNFENEPKDWQETEDGKFRDTFPSNLWTDLSVPFWSMPENTDHPTQKPEKLLAKIILASSNPGDVVFDPFLGSGTTAVVAKKLGRIYQGFELEEKFCALTVKRLNKADTDKKIQGFEAGVFWERNSI